MVAINHINFALGSSSSQSCLLNRALPCFGNLANILASLPCFGILANILHLCLALATLPTLSQEMLGKGKARGPFNTFFASVCLFKTPARARWWHIITNSMWLRLPVPLYLQKAIWAPIFFNCSFMTFKGDGRYYVRPRENAANATAPARCTRLSTINPHLFQEMKTLWTPQLDTIRRQKPFSSRPAGEKRRRHLDAG